jgi:hypothetical protein
MRLKKIYIENFGPFRTYSIDFLEEDEACLLITGKNNEGKSSLLSALRLVAAALKVIGNPSYLTRHNGEEYYSLLKQDIDRLQVKRLIHNYQNVTAQIAAEFTDELRVSVYIDPVTESIYADHYRLRPSDYRKIFGFMPPLGPIAEREEVIRGKNHLIQNLGTSLAPRHLRNHFMQLLTPIQFDLIKKIVKNSWNNIELDNYEVNFRNGIISCFYKESGITREISWAGQGLQVWFQIITHLVRLSDHNILVLDEPEINLHPEMQNELLRIIRENFHGTVLIATHSVELMNNVNISHIINIRKENIRPAIKSTANRYYLERVRSEIGSNFNLIASQFDKVSVILFTEDVSDFEILSGFAKGLNIRTKAFNIPLHGFSQHPKCQSYKEAYDLLIGHKPNYSLLLDRDYYPQEHLDSISETHKKYGIKTVFTPGKEIENLFIDCDFLLSLLPKVNSDQFIEFFDNLFATLYLDCFSDFLSLSQKFSDPKLDLNTLTKKIKPIFDNKWNNPEERTTLVDGKSALKSIKQFFRTTTKTNLTTSHLVDKLRNFDSSKVNFIKDIYYV